MVVPVFNRAKLLKECLDSVVAQTFTNWECIIVDDGSIDGSLNIAEEYAARDARFRALARRGSMKGAAACRNHGLAATNSPYVLFLDSDDLLHTRCLERRVAFMERNRCLDFAVFQSFMFTDYPGDSDKLWNIYKPDSDLLRYLKLDVVWPVNGPLWRLQVVRDIGGFDETLPGWQDWQIHMIALLKGLRYSKVPTTPDCFVRQHGGPQISKAAGSVAHVASKTEFLMRLIGIYRKRFQSELSLSHAVWALAWRQVVLLQEGDMLAKALQHWFQLRRLGYVDLLAWFEGALALILHGCPGGSRAWSRVSRWPESVTRSVDRSTCHNVSLAEGHDLGCGQYPPSYKLNFNDIVVNPRFEKK